MARLILSLDGQVMAEYNMNKERYTIGRLPDNDIRIDNPAVSGHHSLIINILNDSFLEDLNSTNGTYVNGTRIGNRDVPLRDGDRIRVGTVELRLLRRWNNGDTSETAMLGDTALPFKLDDPAVKRKLRERYGANVPLEEPVISPVAIFESPLLETVLTR